LFYYEDGNGGYYGSGDYGGSGDYDVKGGYGDSGEYGVTGGNKRKQKNASRLHAYPFFLKCVG